MPGPLPADNHARQPEPRHTTISAAMEDYLKAIHRLQQGEERVTTLALASELGLSGPSVTNMVKRLAELGLTLEAQTQETSDATPGTAIAQSPQAGTKVERGTTVTVTFAKEPQRPEPPTIGRAGVPPEAGRTASMGPP